MNPIIGIDFGTSYSLAAVVNRDGAAESVPDMERSDRTPLMPSVASFDFDGNPIWKADTVRLEIEGGYGEGSSPTLAGDALIVVADHEGESKIYAFDKKTGEVLWEKDRIEDSTWATPLAVAFGGALQIVTSGENFVRSYDAKTGEIVWQCGGTECS